MKKLAPYLVLVAITLVSCTNREILHGSSSDKPPTFKVGKKPMLASKARADEPEKDAKPAEKLETNLSESEKAATGENTEKPEASTKSEDTVEVSKERKMRVWFARENKGSVQPYAVERELDKKEPLRSAVIQLLEGPTEAERKSGIKSEVPVGTVLISLKKKDNVVELNLSRRFGAGGVDSIETRLQQLELTIKEVAGHDKVFLDIEGKRLTSAGDGLEVKQPLNL